MISFRARSFVIPRMGRVRETMDLSDPQFRLRTRKSMNQNEKSHPRKKNKKTNELTPTHVPCEICCSIHSLVEWITTDLSINFEKSSDAEKSMKCVYRSFSNCLLWGIPHQKWNIVHTNFILKHLIRYIPRTYNCNRFPCSGIGKRELEHGIRNVPNSEWFLRWRWHLKIKNNRRKLILTVESIW